MADLATTSPQALEGLSDRQRVVLAAARQMNNRAQPVSYDSIKLKDSEKKVLDIDGKPLPRGEYFIESYDPAKREKTFRCIGAKPKVAIVHRCWTYSRYEDGTGLVAWTSDIQSLDETGWVTLFAKKDGQVGTAFEGRYKPDFKEFIKKHYSQPTPSGHLKSLLDFQTLLYVLFEGKVHRMFVSNASACGIPEGEKAPSFKDPQPGSLLTFIETTRGAEMQGSLPEYLCELGAVFREDMERPFYIRTFTNAGPNPDLGLALTELDKLSTLYKQTERAIGERSAIAELRREQGTQAPVDLPVIDMTQYGQDIKPEDLPF